MNDPTIFTLLLDRLGVPHTAEFSDMRYKTMSFKSLFGFSRLLKSYAIDSEGLKFTDKSMITELSTPFMAQTLSDFVIVRNIAGGKIEYETENISASLPVEDFINDWSGVALAVYPDTRSCEPDYRLHRRDSLIDRGKKAVLALSVAALVIYLVVTNRIYSSAGAISALVLNAAGLYVTWLLVQKSLKIKSAAADAMCGVIERHGCDHVLQTKAAKFFGLLGWSEVGFAYFGISLAAILIWPSSLPVLALANVCCLPFSFWSVWYQKFRAKAWCTLCLTVQALLWLIFFSNLISGQLEKAWPPAMVDFIVLLTCYLAALLALNRIVPKFDNSEK